VVAAGLTLTLLPVTVPTPWSIERLDAPLTFQERVAVCPGVIELGVAVNDAMTGFPESPGCATARWRTVAAAAGIAMKIARQENALVLKMQINYARVGCVVNR
jgi:hypothetical protein